MRDRNIFKYYIFIFLEIYSNLVKKFADIPAIFI